MRRRFRGMENYTCGSKRSSTGRERRPRTPQSPAERPPEGPRHFRRSQSVIVGYDTLKSIVNPSALLPHYRIVERLHPPPTDLFCWADNDPIINNILLQAEKQSEDNRFSAILTLGHFCHDVREEFSQNENLCTQTAFANG